METVLVQLLGGPADGQLVALPPDPWRLYVLLADGEHAAYDVGLHTQRWADGVESSFYEGHYILTSGATLPQDALTVPLGAPVPPSS